MDEDSWISVPFIKTDICLFLIFSLLPTNNTLFLEALTINLFMVIYLPRGFIKVRL